MTDQAPFDVSAAINIEAEQAVLGAVMLDNTALAGRIAFLEPEHFSEPLHGRIFTAIRGLVERGRKADPITLRPYLDDDKVGEDMTVSQYLARIVAEAVPVMMVRDYGLAVLDSHAARKAAGICDEFAGKFIARGSATGIVELVGELEDAIGGVRSLAPSKDTRSAIGGFVDEFMASLAPDRVQNRDLIPFPLPEIATVLQSDGWEPGNLYGLLASSGEGKTSFVLQIMRAAAEAGHPVLLMSYDQNGVQVTRQMVSQGAGVTLGQMMQKGGIGIGDAGLIETESRSLARLPMEIVRLRSEKIGRIAGYAQAFAKRWSQRSQPDGSSWRCPLIVLDHNRKVTPDDPRAHEGRIAGSVNGAGKALAEEIGAAVLYLNQRSSGGMRRDVPRPIVADLFGGEQAKEDYDAILYLYRPEFWRDEKLKVAADAKEREKIALRFLVDGEPPEGKAEIGALKLRYGNSRVTEIVAFEGRYTRYSSLRRQERELPF